MADPKSTIVKFKPGAYMLTEKQMATCLYIIKEGQVEVFKMDTENKKIPLALVNSGEYIGELSLLAGMPHSANAVALTNVTAIKIEKTAIDAQLREVPKWFLGITRTVTMRLIQTNEVLRRNSIVDEKLSSAIRVVGEHSGLKTEEESEKESKPQAAVWNPESE